MQTISSTIEAVTIYTRGARVKRVARLRRNGAYPRTVQIGGLPLTLEDASLQISMEPAGGAAGVLPVAADVRVALEVPDVDPELQPADDTELEAARREEQRLTALVAQIGREGGRVRNLVVAPRPAGEEGKAPPPSPTAARLALLEFREAQTQRLLDELQEVQHSLREATHRRKELEERDRLASTARQARDSELRKSAVVALRSGAGVEPEEIRLVVEYLVPGARWAPAYAVHLGAESAEARLFMRAMVAQRTGEDWNGVRLTLSTADAQRWTELPELKSIRIGRRQRAPTRVGWRPPPTGAELLYADFDRSFPERELERELKRKRKRKRAKKEVPKEELWESAASVDMRDEPAFNGAPPPPMVPPPAPMSAAAAAPMPGAPPAQRSLKAKGRAAPRPHRAPSAKSIAFETAVTGGALLERELSIGGRGPAGRAEPEPAPGVRAADDMLAYGNLRMPSPASAQRGRLVVADRTQVYLELLVQQRVQVSFDVLHTIAGAVRLAEAVGDSTPPRGCTFAASDRYDYAYVAEAGITIPSDGHFHSIPMMNRSAPANARFVVVPRESTDAFRFVEVSNPLDAPLLPGPADIYLGKDFLLTTNVRSTPVKGKLELGLGVEQAVKVSRNTQFSEESAGLIGGSRSLQHAIDIEVVNHLKRTIDLEVRERIPVTVTDRQKDDIEVTLQSVTPAWKEFQPFPDRAEHARLKGGYHWQLRLAAGENKKLKVAYEIRISSKHELVGGNRREV